MTDSRGSTARHPSSHPSSKSALLAILVTCIGYAYFNIGDAAVKILAPRFHFSQVVFLSCAVIISCMLGYGWWTEGKKAFRILHPGLMFWRAALSCVIAVLNTFALPNVQLTTFYTLVFTSPFWVALLSSLFLGEKLERQRIGVILAGFAVILFIFRPGGGLFNVYALMVLVSAFLYSCSMVLMRKMGPNESRTMIISSGSFISMLAVFPFLPGHFIMPTPYEWGLFFMMGLLGAIGVTCIAYAFQNAPSAATIAPYHYTQIVWGALMGYYLFNEVPDQRTLIGAAVIVGAGLYLIYGETHGKKRVESTARADIDQAV